MEQTNKELYEAPVTTVLEVKSEGVICASGGGYPEWEQQNI